MAKTGKCAAWVLYATSALLVLCLTGKLVAGHPPSHRAHSTYPGKVVASNHTMWLGPYVLFQGVRINGKHKSRVTWFAKDGEAIKEVTTSRIEPNPYQIIEYSRDSIIVHSIHDTSTVVLPPDNEYTDSRIRVFERGKYVQRLYWGSDGINTDYYANGSLVGTYGPHHSKSGVPFSVSRSGSFAYSVVDSLAVNHCRVVSVDSLQSEVFAFELDRPVRGITQSPTGELVVVQFAEDRGGNGDNVFASCFSTGETVEVNLSRDIRLIGWVPNTEKMVAAGPAWSIDRTYSLLDWRTGEIEWVVSDPLEYTRNDVAVTEDYLVLTGLAIRESIAHGPVIPNDLRGTVRMLAAIDIGTGELVAKWYEPTFAGRWSEYGPRPPMAHSGGSLVWYEDKLFHVVDENFSEIDFADIKDLRNGWVGPADSGLVYRELR